MLDLTYNFIDNEGIQHLINAGDNLLSRVQYEEK
jgi:hypothetical protein